MASNANQEQLQLNKLMLKCLERRGKSDKNVEASFNVESKESMYKRIIQRKLKLIKENKKENLVNIKLYIEEHLNQIGPILFASCPEWTIWSAKRKIQKHFKPMKFKVKHMHVLCGLSIAHDHQTLQDCGVSKNNDVLYVYVSQPEQPDPMAAVGLLEPEEYLESEFKQMEINDFGSEALDFPVDTEHAQAQEQQSLVSGLIEIEETIDTSTPMSVLGNNVPWMCLQCMGFNDFNLKKCAFCQSEMSKHTNSHVTAPSNSHHQDLFDENPTSNAPDTESKKRWQNYEQHISATKQRIMFCQEPTECMICMGEAAAGETVILMECLHTFCKDCLEQHVLLNENAIVCCPYIDDDYECPSQIQQREIQALISPDDFEKFLSRSLSFAERQTSNSYHCQSPNCPGWCEYDDTVNVFVCPVCKVENCLTCKAIHEGVSCLVYQEKLQNTATNDKSSKQTKNLLQRLVKTKDAMHCPQCNIIIQKMKGCDWVRCSMCKTEICWVTKGPRWGPGGRGDISGGCRCNVDGRKCHRKCNNCH